MSGSKKYPKFPERVQEGLVDIFGEKGRYVFYSFALLVTSQL